MNWLKQNTLISTFLTTTLLLGSVSAQPANAQGLIANPGAVLEAFCDYETSRRTIIYIDQSMVSLTDENWFRDIISRLDYLPAERVHVRLINESTNRVDSLWETCHPSLTNEVYEQEQNRSSVFRRGVDRNLQDAGQAFRQGMNRSLAAALKDVTRQSAPRYESDFPSKSILEALFYDVGIFRLEGKTTRVVIFSNMVENSEFVTPEQFVESKPAELARNVAARLDTDFQNAEFFVHGVGYTHNNSSLDKGVQEFWATWLNRSGGFLASFGRQLSLPNLGSEVSFHSYRGVMPQSDGSYIAVRLRLGFTEQGELTNSWFGLRDIRYPLTGSASCSSQSCKVNANIDFADESYNLFTEEDIITLSGSIDDLVGEIGGADTSVQTTDGSRFSIPLEFTKDDRLTF